MDGEAVKANLECFRDGSGGQAQTLSDLEEVEVVTETEVVLHLSQPNPAMFYYLSDAAGLIANPASFDEITSQVFGTEAQAYGPELDTFASVAPVTEVDPRPEPGADEHHSLTITEGRVLIRSTSAEGAFRALSGLLQLLTVDKTGNVWAPVGTVVDGPRYIWRGLSLDVVRHFFTLDEVRRVIDLLALYKFNVLHLHLTDNEGWRLESRAYPELTRTRSDGTRTHYTREEFANLVAHAARRYITVVPEVDLPGHTHAAFDARLELAGDIVHPHPWLRHLHPDSAPARCFAREVIAEFAVATPGQEAARVRLGLPGYAPITVADTFDWEPSEEVASGTMVAGVEAAVWGKTVTGFGDLAFLLLPRLPGVAEGLGPLLAPRGRATEDAWPVTRPCGRNSALSTTSVPWLPYGTTEKPSVRGHLPPRQPVCLVGPFLPDMALKLRLTGHA